MLELVSLLRPLATWQVLLAVCLLDMALIAMRLSWPADLNAERLHSLDHHQQQQHQERLQRRLKLIELLSRQAELTQEVQNSRLELEASRRQLEGLMAADAARDLAESEQLRLLAEGVEDLEQSVAQLVAARAEKVKARGSRMNDTQSDSTT
ncbi:hypothetical protein PoB_003007500 [Plakobranchus ocellatus]|uniref:Uncharacterized protein n=1 Tax=Plakobranchus ocellatus TaxID=259542 RepID=A0AAV4A9V8_9GAST|nr:hypothetical protein PoB_003007500 [Plakobranchus ocellatus]